MANEFVEGTKLTVIWNSIMPMKEMEHELKVLFAKYGLEFYASGSDLVDYGRRLVYEVPVKKVQRVPIRWSGLVHKSLKHEFGLLLGAFGYKCIGKTRETDDEDFELVFQQPV